MTTVLLRNYCTVFKYINIIYVLREIRILGLMYLYLNIHFTHIYLPS